jgi:hypothetical protein
MLYNRESLWMETIASGRHHQRKGPQLCSPASPHGRRVLLRGLASVRGGVDK